jgi:hypothetical protein
LTHRGPRGTVPGLVVGELAASPSLSSLDAADGDDTLVMHVPMAALLSTSLSARRSPVSSLSPFLHMPHRTAWDLRWPHMVDPPGTDGPRWFRSWEGAFSSAPISYRFVILIISVISSHVGLDS